MDHITVRAFQAPQEPELCEEFLAEHRKVLEDFGISHVTTNNETWMHDPNTYVVVAIHEHLGMVGGVRLKLDDGATPLPMANAIRKLDPDVDEVLEKLRESGNGEVCGLWIAQRFNGMGLPVILGHAVTAISVGLGAHKLVCFVAHYTQKYPARNGFVLLEEVGDHGYFPKYPIPRIIAIAMVNPDTMLLEHAPPEHREMIYSLRLHPEQERVLAPMRKPIRVTYRIRLVSKVHDLYAHRQMRSQGMRRTG